MMTLVRARLSFVLLWPFSGGRSVTVTVVEVISERPDPVHIISYDMGTIYLETIPKYGSSTLERLSFLAGTRTDRNSGRSSQACSGSSGRGANIKDCGSGCCHFLLSTLCDL